MRRGARRPVVLGLLAALAVVPAGCALPDTQSAVQVDTSLITSEEVRIAVVTHAAPGDQFWDFVRSGVDSAADDLGVSVSYTNSPNPGEQATLIDNAVADGANGLVVSMANPPALRSSIRQATQAGIPVVTINSGIQDWKAFGAFTHVGQSESIAGKAVGTQLNQENLENVVCVIQEAGNIALEDRCKAAASTFDGTMSNLQVDGTDTNGTSSSITSRLRADKGVDGVVTLSGQVASLAVGAASAAGSDVDVATFDVDENVLASIIRGDVSFAIDQQPFAQGYEGVAAVYLRLVDGVTLGGGQPIYTGPTIIDRSSAETALAALTGDSR